MPKAPAPNKGEAAYSLILRSEFPGCQIEYEAVTLRLPSGTRYTADWAVWMPGARLLLVEVKGSYRLGSADRSALAFKSAVAAYPDIEFRHATKSQDGWDITKANLPRK